MTGRVHVVVPAGIDDTARPSGGNGYDRRVCAELVTRGWDVRRHAVTDSAELASTVASLPDRSLVLVDGLIASPAPEILVPAARRLRLAVLVHMPLDSAAEQDVLATATVVITTSVWTSTWLLDRYRLRPAVLYAAPPGVDPAPRATGTPEGRRLLCVAAVVPHKGHDVLLTALAGRREPAWHCELIGPLDRDPAYAARVRHQAERDGIGGRVHFTGPLAPPDLAARYAAADLLVQASRAETFGMVVVEALARGVPVVASNVGGVPEALGRAPDGSLPGALVAPGDPRALAAALGDWLGEDEVRSRWRAAAQARRTTLTGWPTTAAAVADALAAALR